MQPKLYKLAFALCFFLITFYPDASHAQCTGRYLDTMFTAVDSFYNIVYTTSAGGTAGDTLLMDVYQPHGDTACLRHLAIWVHGGAFFEGSKNDGDIEFLSDRFASRGYVCAALNYRLAGGIYDLYDSAQIFKYAYEAFSDVKAAIRYFYMSAQQGNYWNIDTTSIFIGGSSAGGIAVDFVASLDSLDQIAAAFQSIATSNGGIDGNSGNAGYSSNVIGVASLAGAVNSVDWLHAGMPPMIMCQGTADGTVPYNCGLALTQYTGGLYPTIDFCGSGAMSPVLDSLGVPYSLLPFPGSGHVPWDTNSVMMNEVDSAVSAFFYQIKCTQTAGYCNEPSGIVNIAPTAQVMIYPNPTSDHIQIAVQDRNELSLLTLYDMTGREVSQLPVSGKNANLSVKGLSAGVYTLKVELKNPNTVPVTKKIEVE